ncbi:hypothetical protein ACFSUD_05625 [Sulfitobacter aestuarii]|uniref:AAA+ family ATPase n=1 Tax=Sulfitobacter aestuarii TaxID=2161676 RepID=A0ABW5TZF1_9RHOB
MKRTALILAFSCALAVPAFAQSIEPEPAPDPQDEESFSLMERGAQMFMEGIMRQMEPAFEDLSDLADQMRPGLRNFAREMGPKLKELVDEVEDWNAYQAPEMLPNGDIIIRRKPDHPLEPPEKPTEPNPQIEL